MSTTPAILAIDNCIAALVALRAETIRTGLDFQSSGYADVLHTFHDLTEIDAVYDAAQEITPSDDDFDVFGLPLHSRASRVASMQAGAA